MEYVEPPLVIVAAMTRKNQVIGDNNRLLWHIPDDLQRFKSLTLGHPIIMGRKTFESILAILGKPLPGRTSIVVTRNQSYTHEGVTVTHTLEAAIAAAKSERPTEIHIGGGSELYTQALPYTSQLYITWIDDESSGDAHFPTFLPDFTVTTTHPPRTHHGLSYQWVDYKRK